MLSAVSSSKRTDAEVAEQYSVEVIEAALLRSLPGYDPFEQAGEHRYDHEAAQTVVDFFAECLTHIEGAKSGQAFVLEPWQEAVIRNLFGWKRPDGTRRYREVFLYVPRKNGKTPFAAGILNYVLFCDGEPGAQIYGAAADTDQAAVLFRHAKGMVKNEPLLEEQARIYDANRSIVLLADFASSYRVLSAEADTKHGGNSHLVLIDELHAQPNRNLVDVLQTSLASKNRRQPMIIYVTTADTDRPSICNEKLDFACKVRDGIVEEPSLLPVIYETLKDEDWKSEAVWEKANPNLDISVSREYLRSECKKAIEIPAYENTFKRLHLNMKTEQAERIIVMDQWDKAKREVTEQEFLGQAFYGALDIGATSDFTAWIKLFPHKDEEQVEVEEFDHRGDVTGKRVLVRRSYTLLSMFWLPSHPVRRDTRMQEQIDTWSRQGFIRRTEGNVVDYDRVVSDIKADAQRFSLMRLGLDRGFQGGSTATDLMGIFGDKVFNFAQGILSMNAPFRELLELLAVGRIHHDGNPVLRWMASNVAAERKGGLIKPSKDKSAEKIDGITAAVMALGVAITETKGPSVYETRGPLSFGGEA